MKGQTLQPPLPDPQVAREFGMVAGAPPGGLRSGSTD
jgi:hypothetical protein